MQLVYGTVPAKKWWRWFSAKNMWCDFALEDDNDNMTKIVRKNKKTIVDIESIKKYVKDMGINVAPKTLHWKRKNCKGKYANYSYFIPRNVKLPFIVSRYEPRQKSLETVHQNGAKKIAYIKIEVGKQEYKELFKLVKDDDRIQLIKGRDTHICEIGIEGLSNSIKICNVLIKAVDNKGTIAGIAIKNSKRYCEMNPDNLIEILADEYVNLIIGLNKKKIQIIGYCISGLIAVEIARRLMERGLEIFDLVLIDSHPIQYQLEDELLMEITFLPSLGIEISQLGLGEISNEELYKAVLYLYNEFKKEIPSRSIQYLPDEYINLKKILLKLDCMEKRQRFELYSKMALEKAENQFPVDMCIDLFAAYKQSFKAAQFVPEVYAGNIRFLLAEESTSFIPDNDEETLAFWKNTCLDDMSVEMIKGNHITCTENKENACTLCKKISKCFQD